MQRIIIFTMVVVILAMVNFEIYKKEQLIAEGNSILLELAPHDPRSLIQGDYMVLRYKIARLLELQSIQKDGCLVLELDEQNVAHFKRIYQEHRALEAEEILLRFRKRKKNIRLGAESFFFQEGDAQYYNNARYGELKIVPNGESVLIGLRDVDFNLLAAPNPVNEAELN
ncbi:MAG: GDYXXLXY domain-containing protein [Thiomargarita sp.]|nr:GDYXXLXY domain-containing protein [Thiomargarita sp.]